MEADALLRIARGIVDKVPMPLSITVGTEGEANARVVQTSKLSDDWTVRFMTDRRSRKAQEVGRTGRMTLAYQCDADNTYVTLVGRAKVIDDVQVKKAIWSPASFKWHPGGPTDPNVVLIDFIADRIELWSSANGIMPDPTKGLWAAALSREQDGWRPHLTLPSG
ncbi:MAG: pyridoxamine 5'-phosphate oxidase family protein [Alphaproteobacteria bacterium]|nr:pyridoxamine 5'-phosphate oxidase family protein [Alphaproteobacteria bacterium]